jgi:hypothetical protein
MSRLFRFMYSNRIVTDHLRRILPDGRFLSEVEACNLLQNNNVAYKSL